MSHRIDQLAADLLAELKTVQGAVDKVAARKRHGREVPPVRYTPLAGEVDRFARALREISQGGQAAGYRPGFTEALASFNERHAA